MKEPVVKGRDKAGCKIVLINKTLLTAGSSHRQQVVLSGADRQTANRAAKGVTAVREGNKDRTLKISAGAENGFANNRVRIQRLPVNSQ